MFIGHLGLIVVRSVWVCQLPSLMRMHKDMYGNVRTLQYNGHIWHTIFTARKRSCGKVMFSHLSVSHFVHGRCLPLVQGSLPHPLGQTPPSQAPPGRHPPGQKSPLGRPPRQTPSWKHTPPAQCMLGYIPLPSACWDTVNKRVVLIPLECILVVQTFCITEVFLQKTKKRKPIQYEKQFLSQKLDWTSFKFPALK